jgi:hypothetical protein
MSSGLSKAEAALKSSANAETIDVKRMVCDVCCVVKLGSKFQWNVFTVKRPELLVTNKVDIAGYLQGRPWTLKLCVPCDIEMQ